LLAVAVALMELVVDGLAALAALVVSFTPPITTWRLALYLSRLATVVLLAALAVAIR
jgi:ABC-type uncharacterized transport system permease subunit